MIATYKALHVIIVREGGVKRKRKGGRGELYGEMNTHNCCGYSWSGIEFPYILSFHLYTLIFPTSVKKSSV